MSHGSDHDHDVRQMFTQSFWDERYSGSDRIWSGNPNPRLVEQVADLAPGAALDIGCGEGADVVWLARRGWQVTGLDVSQVAIDRAQAHAAEAEVDDRTSWLRADLMAGDTAPGGFDLVSAQFMHVPTDDFTRVWTAVAGAVRPGGSLLVVGHHPADAATGCATLTSHTCSSRRSRSSARSTLRAGRSGSPTPRRGRRPTATATR